MAKTFNYFNNCVGWDRKDVDSLSEMIDNAIQISRKTFLKYINPSDLAWLADSFGYSKHPKQGLTMAGDWHISYHRSKLNGKRVYYFKHSAIEYVFA